MMNMYNTVPKIHEENSAFLFETKLLELSGDINFIHFLFSINFIRSL